MRTEMVGDVARRPGSAKLRLFLPLMAAVLALTVLIASSVPASANNGMTQVSGMLYIDFFEVCQDFPDKEGALPDYAAWMVGDMAGCVYMYVDWENSKCTPSGVYNEVGLEFYDIDGGNLGLVGTYESDYRFTGKFEDCPTASGQIFGRCQHPVNVGSGTGDFEDVTGRLDMKDDVENQCSYYTGHLRLP